MTLPTPLRGACANGIEHSRARNRKHCAIDVLRQFLDRAQALRARESSGRFGLTR